MTIRCAKPVYLNISFISSSNSAFSPKIAALEKPYIVYSSEKLGEFAEKCALELDFHEIADKLYPQFENFLNFYVNKKTKKYKFKFKIKGSTLTFMRKDAIDYQLKLADKGIQVPPKVWGSLYGYDSDEFEALMMEAKCGNMQDLTFLLLNANIKEIENQEMPIVYIISNYFNKYKKIYAFIVLASIFTTAISVGIGFLQNISKNSNSLT